MKATIAHKVLNSANLKAHLGSPGPEAYREAAKDFPHKTATHTRSELEFVPEQFRKHRKGEQGYKKTEILLFEDGSEISFCIGYEIND